MFFLKYVCIYACTPNTSTYTKARFSVMNTHLKSEKQSITTKGTKHKVTRMKNHTAPSPLWAETAYLCKSNWNDRQVGIYHECIFNSKQNEHILFIYIIEQFEWSLLLKILDCLDKIAFETWLLKFHNNNKKETFMSSSRNLVQDVMIFQWKLSLLSTTCTHENACTIVVIPAKLFWSLFSSPWLEKLDHC